MPKKILPHHHHNNMNLDKLFDNIPACEELQIVADVFKEISDSSRIRIFWLLCHCEECVINLSAIMDMSAPAVSHHLARLKSKGLIVSRREGKEVYYRAADTNVVSMLHRIIESMVEITCPENGPAPSPDEDGNDRPA